MDTVALADGRTILIGKNRNPFAVLFFSIITIGIYWLVWYYKINNEIRHHEPSIRVSPGLGVVAQFVPIANIISDYNTATRIHRMEIADDSPNNISPLVTIILLFFFAIGYVFQVQSHLNAHWDRHRFATSRTRGLEGIPSAETRQLSGAAVNVEIPALAPSGATAEQPRPVGLRSPDGVYWWDGQQWRLGQGPTR